MRKVTVMVAMLIGVGILFGAIFTYKWYVNTVVKKLEAENKNPIVTISSTTAATTQWRAEIKVIGSSRTVKGVNVTPELAGMITKLNFTPGSTVSKGKLLVQLDISTDVAKLHQLQADAKIADITYHRDLRQYKVGGVSKETVDQDEAQFKSTAAQVAEQQALIEKKTVRAPFSGRMGVRLVNLGQYLNPGDNIASLETLQPIYIDFYVPQEQIPRLKLGQNVEIKVDAYSKEKFEAPITTINPLVDSSVRNIYVEATLKNTQEKVLPGMYIYITLKTGQPKSYITLPQTAVTFNPYGSLVYILTKTNKKFKNKTVWKARQQFVTTGQMRGDQVSILKGVKANDVVVSSGQLKVKNGSYVVINNTLQPADSPDPKLQSE